MKFYFSQNLLTGFKRTWKLILSGLLLTCLLVACDTSDQKNFVRFQIDGQSYEVKTPALVITRMVEGLGFYDLNYDPLSSIPGAIVQWRMEMKPLDKLVGQDLDLNTVDPNKVLPMVTLRLTEDLILQSQQKSNIHFKIDKLEEGFVKGSFSATDLEYISKKKEVAGKVDVTAQFRVRLVEKDWKDAVRSRKRSSK